MNPPLHPPRRHGFFVRSAARPLHAFSLVELLTVIAVLGFVIAILAPQIVPKNLERAGEFRDRRNAQSLVTAFSSAQVAGVKFLVDGDIESTIDRIVTGASANGGVFSGQHFSVPGLSEADQDAAARYLELKGSLLVYNSGF